MTRLVILLGASALASPGIAQHQGHIAPTPSATASACTPEHEAMGHCTLPSEPETADPHAGHQMPAQSQSADPHAGHQMPAQPQQVDPHADHQMPAQPQQVDPHADHQMPAPEDPHAGHDVAHTAVEPPVGPPPPEAFSGPEHAADALFGGTAMARSRREMYRIHGAVPAYRVMIDRLEARVRNGRDGYELDAQAWYGGDIDKLWLKAEAHGEFGERFEGAELQALWSRAISPFFDVQTGVRYDARRGSDRGHLVLGIQGLAPYWIEIDAAAFLSNRGEVTARFEAEHDVRITQRLILQPRGEIDLSLQDVPELRIGAGLSKVAVGARLRYQVTQLFAPYIGVEYERAFGDTRRFRRADGNDAGAWNLLAGIRFWF